MRGTVAKRLRRRIYGTEGSPRAREYTFRSLMHRLASGSVVPGRGSIRTADNARRAYQVLKRAWRDGSTASRRAYAAKRVGQP